MKPRRVVSANRPVYRRPNPRLARPVVTVPKLNWRLWATIIGTVIVIAWWWQGFAIRDIKVTGNRALSTTTMQQYTHDEIARHGWWGNLTTLDAPGLSQSLVADHYQLKTVQVSRQWPHTLRLKIEERTPSLIWKTGNDTYLLDLDGTIISAASASKSKLPTIVDTTGLPVKIGERVVSGRFVAFCVDLTQGMAQKTGIGITGLSVVDTTTEVTVSTTKGYVVKFDTTRPASEGLAELQRVLAELAKEQKTPSSYIDLRIERKAYYK